MRLSTALSRCAGRVDVDDEVSVAWRAAVDHDIAVYGVPRFVIVDLHTVTAHNSIAVRFKSAVWTRGLFNVLEQGIIFTGSNHHSGIVISTVLRLPGMKNSALVGDELVLEQTIAGFREGRPFAGVPSRRN